MTVDQFLAQDCGRQASQNLLDFQATRSKACSPPVAPLELQQTISGSSQDSSWIVMTHTQLWRSADVHHQSRQLVNRDDQCPAACWTGQADRLVWPKYTSEVNLKPAKYSSVQSSMVHSRSGRLICAPHRLSEVSTALRLKLIQCWSD